MPRRPIFSRGLPIQKRECLSCCLLPGLPVWPSVLSQAGIFPLMLIHTSVVMECVANSSFPSRHQPLCLLPLPSALATNYASLKGGWVLLLAPSGWVRRIQLSVAARVRIRSNFSFSSRPDQLMTVGCAVAISSPQILSLPLPVFLKKGGMMRAVSPWYLVAWKTYFTVRNIFQAIDLCFLSLSSLSCRVSLFCMLAPSALGSEFTRVCLLRCHCAPSRLKGPDGR